MKEILLTMYMMMNRIRVWLQSQTNVARRPLQVAENAKAMSEKKPGIIDGNVPDYHVDGNSNRKKKTRSH